MKMETVFSSESFGTDLPSYTISYLEDRKHFTRTFALGVVRCLNLNEWKSLFGIPDTYFLNGFSPIFHPISNNLLRT